VEQAAKTLGENKSLSLNVGRNELINDALVLAI
jgi:hypothetical protein